MSHKSEHSESESGKLSHAELLQLLIGGIKNVVQSPIREQIS